MMLAYNHGEINKDRKKLGTAIYNDVSKVLDSLNDLTGSLEYFRWGKDIELGIGTINNCQVVESAKKEEKDPLDSYLESKSNDVEFQKMFSESKSEIMQAVYGDNLSLCRLRVEEGLTQNALAQKMGITQPMVAKLESGIPDIRYTTMEKLSEALNRPIEQIIVAIKNDKNLKKPQKNA